MFHTCAFIALEGFNGKFSIANRTTSQGLPYDFSSIMHFRHNAFSCDRHKSTVVPRSRTISKTLLGSSATATDLDFLHLNLLYCEGTCIDGTFFHVHVRSYMVIYMYFQQVHACKFHVHVQLYILYIQTRARNDSSKQSAQCRATSSYTLKNSSSSPFCCFSFSLTTSIIRSIMRVLIMLALQCVGVSKAPTVL